MAGYDELNPLDNSKINAFPANERAQRASTKALFIKEHDLATGYHEFGFGSKALRDALATPIDGMVFVRTDAVNPGIDGRNGGTWDQIATLIPEGTICVFYNDAAPDGWVFTGSLGDNLMMVTSTEANGGSALAASDWTFDGVTVAGHTLSVAEIPDHFHEIHRIDNGSGATDTLGRDATGLDDAGSLGFVTEGTGGDGAHTHPSLVDNGWRPQSVQVILCERVSAL